MWLEPMRRFWRQRLDALATELARGRRERRTTTPEEAPPPRPADDR